MPPSAAGGCFSRMIFFSVKMGKKDEFRPEGVYVRHFPQPRTGQAPVNGGRPGPAGADNALPPKPRRKTYSVSGRSVCSWGAARPPRICL